MGDIPGTGIVVFHHGAFGGASRRIANLFFHLNRTYPDKFYLLVNRHLFNQLKEIYGELPEKNIRIIETSEDRLVNNLKTENDTPRFYADYAEDPMETDRRHTILRKIYWFTKNKNKYRKLFRKIEAVRAELDIKVFYGVSAGVLPLVFYFDESPHRASVIFSDMDSWFTDVHGDMKKLWYTKYYSYNYAMENSSLVDFLSPYIVDGVRKRGVNIRNECVRIAPCSFADYSKCSAEGKTGIEIAFSSRLEMDKNPLLYLEAAREIIDKYPDVKFYILGEGSLVNEVKEFIETNKLSSNIDFRFHKNPPEVFKGTSIFVSLQSGTNYPSQSVLEAMACGNAVIASNRGDTHLFIDENNGILVELNRDEVAGAIESLIKDPEKARRLGRNGMERVTREHTIERFSDYFLSLIKDAVK